MYSDTTLAARFWSKVEFTESCWLWHGEIIPRGYGRFKHNGNRTVAHRYSYELCIGPIPKGLQLDHLCRVRSCVNPAHLEPVTGRENCLRGESFAAVNARKTHCVRGHALIPDNLVARPDGYRQCVLCTRQTGRERARRRYVPRPRKPLSPYCGKGHLLEGDNLRMVVDKRYEAPVRQCKTCARERQQRRRAQLR